MTTMTMLRPRRGGFYDPDTEVSATIFEDLAYLLDADSHHHRTACGIWCPRRDVVIAIIPDQEDGEVSQ